MSFQRWQFFRKSISALSFLRFSPTKILPFHGGKTLRTVRPELFTISVYSTVSCGSIFILWRLSKGKELQALKIGGGGGSYRIILFVSSYFPIVLTIFFLLPSWFLPPQPLPFSFSSSLDPFVPTRSKRPLFPSHGSSNLARSFALSPLCRRVCGYFESKFTSHNSR